MDEYISREEVLKKFLERGSGYINELTMRDMINEIPAADVQPVKRGRWEEEHYSELLWCYEATCSECGYESTDKYRITNSHRFCENCGARMDLKDGDVE